MLTELNGKGGCVCEPARKGELRCPLIVRPTSEDVVTGELFGILRVLNARWWLPDLLNHALGEVRFQRQVFRDLRIELWQKQRTYPREHLTWTEGQTEVDCIITWENPATTVFIEMKYGSPLSATTANNNGSTGFPSDQLIRNARIGLRENGWFQEDAANSRCHQSVYRAAKIPVQARISSPMSLYQAALAETAIAPADKPEICLMATHCRIAVFS